MAAIAPEVPVMPSAPALKPEPVVTTVPVAEEDECDPEGHKRAREVVEFYHKQAKALQHVLDDYTRERARRVEAEHRCQKLQEELDAANAKNAKLEADLKLAVINGAAMETRALAAEAKLAETEVKLGESIRELGAMRRERDDAVEGRKAAEQQRDAVAQSYMPNAHQKSGNYYITSIEFGGKIITNPATYKRLLEFANSGKSFPVNPTTFGEDPAHKWCKSAAISYIKDVNGQKGPVRTIAGWERENLHQVKLTFE